MDQNNKKEKKEIGRRKFLKVMGAGAVATTAALTGCGDSNRTHSGAGGSASKTGYGEMTYRIHPHNGDKVSLLGYGCMRWPMRPKADGSGEEEIDQETVNELVDYAIEHGVNYFDTSPVYIRGFSERATGIALKRHPREKFYIATKLSNQSNYTRENSLAMYYKSFEELQVDYIDYYLLHSVGGGSGIQLVHDRYIDNGMIDFLLKEKEAGRIRNLGWSFHGQVEVFDYMLSLDIPWDFVQIQLNYVDWRNAQAGRNVNAEYLYAELEKRNIPAVIMEPLLGGRLAKLPDHLVGLLKQQRPDDSVASWAFRYAGTPEGVLTSLSGMTYMEHLEDNLRTHSPLEPITPEENALLERVTELMLNYPIIMCTECQYCMPCPYGINIPGVFAHYNKCVNEANVPTSSRDENYRKARRAFLIGYDRSVPKLRQSDYCIRCGICEPHCPQSIRIPQEMERINKLVEQLKQNVEF
ncbi:MAG: aldo/keto reductase [Bacteroides sp.]|nr:aldo/keto reductase [Bacteroides sp.]